MIILMMRSMRNFICVFPIFALLMFSTPFVYADSIPDWVKNTAGWWATDAISEREFVNAMEFLISDNIIQIKSTSSTTSSDSIPDWVKNTAGWWATDAISEREFVNAMEFLINVGIISVEKDSKCVDDLLMYFDDKQEILTTCSEHESTINEEIIPYDIDLQFNNNGFRGEEFFEEKSPDMYRIFMVGGSTMLGAETTNDTTIPSLFQKMLYLEELDFEIEVINAGISGGTTTYEYELIKSKIVNYNPDLIIMYDGWNDLSADLPVKKTIQNYELICDEAIKNNFELIITIQPIAGFGSKTLTVQEKINSLTGEDHNGFQLLQAKSTYDFLVREILTLDNEFKQNSNGMCNAYDFRNVFDGVTDSIYWDQGHILHSGNLILAERFFEISMNKFDSSFIPSSKFTNIISNYNSNSVIKFLLNQMEISDKTFEEKSRDMSKDDAQKGKFFVLKDEFGDVSKSFVGKDLREFDLKTVNLNGYDLTGANLSGHDLRKIDLTNTIIRGADLSNTNLEDKDLSGMDLRGVNFSNANLKNVDFTGAVFSKDIQVLGDCTDENPALKFIKNFNCVTEIVENESIRTNFENADLTNAKFGKSLEQTSNQMVHFVNFKNANLTNVNANSVQFIGCDFSNAKLEDFTAIQMFIIKSEFSNAEINDAEIKQSWFQTSSFKNAKITNGNFDSITFISLDFTETDFQGTEFSLLTQTEDNIYNCKNNIICKQ